METEIGPQFIDLAMLGHRKEQDMFPFSSLAGCRISAFGLTSPLFSYRHMSATKSIVCFFCVQRVHSFFVTYHLTDWIDGREAISECLMFPENSRNVLRDIDYVEKCGLRCCGVKANLTTAQIEFYKVTCVHARRNFARMVKRLMA